MGFKCRLPKKALWDASMQQLDLARDLQVFCGMLQRIAQFADILKDSKEQLRQVRCPCQLHVHMHTAVTGWLLCTRWQGVPMQWIPMFPKRSRGKPRTIRIHMLGGHWQMCCCRGSTIKPSLGI